MGHRTVHEVLADHVLDDILRHPRVATVFADARQDLNNGVRFPVDYINIIGVPDPRAGVWPAEQIAAFLAVHTGLINGRLATVKVEVGHCPAADAERELNAAVLACVPEPFTTTVNDDQYGASDGDGWLKWSDALVGDRSGESYKIRAEFPNGVPLEIGSTKSSVTLGHLYGGHWGVARWPYGDPFITLLLNTDVFVPPGESPRHPMGL